MNEEGLRVGQLVRSRAGRDAGRYFLVVGVKGQGEVMVADGRLRRVARPKKKNIKHLEVLPARIKEAEVRFAAQSVVTDGIVAQAIEELLAGLARSAAPPEAAGDESGSGPAGGGDTPEEDVRVYA
ncbi:MAG: KOW domain-containing RNA-binding protein [Bacillota bacterium]|jgi:hypothetical protein